MNNRTINRNSNRQSRGSALLLAMVITIMLFIMGLTFVSTTQIEKSTVSSIDTKRTLNNGLKSVVEQINKVMVDDLFGSDTSMLDDDPGPASDEPWDYPGKDDLWLAPIDPVMEVDSSGNVVDYWWSQISDIYNVGLNDHTTTGPLYGLYDPDDPLDAYQSEDPVTTFSSNFLTNNVGPYQSLRAYITEGKRGTELYFNSGILNDWGARADADGDGIADSRWVPIRGTYAPDGSSLYTAVRIIDNCGMININTAHSFNPATTDGTQLSDIDLVGSFLKLDSYNAAKTFEIFNSARCQAVNNADPLYMDAVNYNTNVSTRVLNPRPNPGEKIKPMLFDLNDELELRNRNFLNSDFVSRLELGELRKTFLADGGNAKKYPYFIEDEFVYGNTEYERMQYNWFVNTGIPPYLFTTNSSDYNRNNPEFPAIYNRRHVSTTYSFDRVVFPKINTGSMPPDLANALDDWNEQEDQTLSGFSKPIDISKYSDDPANDPCSLSKEAIAGWLYHCLPDVENDYTPFTNLTAALSLDAKDYVCMLAVNLIDYLDTDTDQATKMTVNGDTYYGFEPARPRLYIGNVARGDFNNSNTIENNYAVSVYNPYSVAAGNGFKLKINSDEITLSANIPAGGSLTYASGVDPSKCFTAATTSNTFDLTTGSQVIELLDNTGIPLDKYSYSLGDLAPATTPPVGEVRIKSTNRKYKILGNFVNADELTKSFHVFETHADSSTAYISASKAKAELDLPSMDIWYQIYTLFDSPNKGFDKFEMSDLSRVFWFAAIEKGGTNHPISELIAKYTATEFADIPYTETNFGRFDFSLNTNFAETYNFITSFNFASDGVDNDGDLLSDDPANDNVDNNQDGLIDSSDTYEVAGSIYEEKTEMAIPGRININTAPWFVISQLPWIRDINGGSVDNTDQVKLSEAIVAYRDKQVMIPSLIDYSGATGRYAGMGYTTEPVTVREDRGFAGISELLNVTHELNTAPPKLASATYDPYCDIRRYGVDEAPPVASATPLNNNAAGSPNPDPSPFLTDSDVIGNDLKERDIIFNRISNLVTVRSDVFTAYILVRVGEYGPMNRYIAIFDRSNVNKPTDKPKLVALQEVVDPS